MGFTATAIQAILFAFFAGFTAVLAAIIGPTYDNLFVPEMAASALYPTSFGGGSFLSAAASFSTYLLGALVDPVIALVGVGVALAYLGRAFLGPWAAKAEPLVTRLVLSILLANFTLPLAGGILAISGAAYPVIAGWDGGSWQHWVNLAGWGELSFSWDNGALAFILTFGIFAVVILLALAVALRNALMAVLLVLLPLFTLLWPVPTLAPLARRAWLLFGELAFLPCIMVVPLELAVGSSSVVMLLAFLTIALGSPALLSLAGAQLTSVGFPSAGPVLANSTQRGLSVASQSMGSYLRPLGANKALAPGVRSVATTAGRALGSGAFPTALPLLAGEFLGRGAGHLIRHVPNAAAQLRPRDKFPRVPRGALMGGRPHG
jgi:hypothetical protein